jgi:3-oxoacyl-[acyl-carrier-protein] synthase-3
MSNACFQSIRIAGITCAIPSNKKTIWEIGKGYFEEEYINRIHDTVGTETFYLSGVNQSAGDLGIVAAKNLMDSLGWNPESIDALIFNSPSLDFITPPTSARIAFELGLSKEVLPVDTNYCCAAFPIGIQMAAQMVEAGRCERVILINSEVGSKAVAATDASLALLPGDAAAATAIERTRIPSKFCIRTITDGSYFRELHMPCFKHLSGESGSDFSHMNGEAVVRFMMLNAPPLINELLDDYGCGREDIDIVYLHQANAFMVKLMAKRTKFPLEKVPMNIGKFGNTGNPSIPLLITDYSRELFAGGSKKALMMGFGAGFTVAAAIMDIGDLAGGDIITAESPGPPEKIVSGMRFAPTVYYESAMIR